MYKISMVLCIGACLALAAGTALAVDERLGDAAPDMQAAKDELLQKRFENQGPDPAPGTLVGGDTCADADTAGSISLPYTDTGNTCSFIDDYDASGMFDCSWSSDSPDVVYLYTPAANGVIDITLCNGSAYDTKLMVYEGDCTTLHNCDDDTCPGWVSELMGLAVTGGVNYYIVVDGYGGGCGDYVIDVTEAFVCNIDCDPAAVPEGEPVCGTDYDDTYNGGCNSTVPVFQSIDCGDIICGESGGFLFTGLDYRDTDWYEFTLTAETDVTWTVEAEFDVLIFIITPDPGADPCAAPTLVSAIADECVETNVTQTLEAGTYWVWVGPQNFGPGAATCGAEYNAELTCVPVLTDACCDRNTAVCTDDVAAADCGAPPPLIYGEDVGAAIPDGGGDPGISHTINVGDSFNITDVDIDVQIDHTWMGDLCVKVEHLGTTVELIKRMNLSAECDATGCCGCSSDNMNLILDDEGTGGLIEDQCAADLSSPPNYVPEGALSDFDGMNAQGDWTISVSDNAGFDTGTLIHWSVHFPGTDPWDPQMDWRPATFCSDFTCTIRDGACCNWATYECTDHVLPQDCVGLNDEWTEFTLCANLDPPCEPPAAIPTVTEWGLIVMTLLGCVLGTILFARRRVSKKA